MRDEWFIRGEIPMTKSEVRAVSVSRLELQTNSIVYDIGAGTGSVSVEAALKVPKGHVYAFEQKEEGCALIRANAEKAGLTNLTVVPGKAPESLAGYPAPDRVFLGGSSGNMEEILDLVTELNPAVQLVINVIALESLNQAMAWFQKKGWEPEVVCMQVSRAAKRGPYHMMQAQNPIYILAAQGQQTQQSQNVPVAPGQNGRAQQDADFPRILLAAPGSGSGKTRFFVKPNLMQMHSSYVVTDPKGTVLVECGKLLQRGGYRIKVLNTINFKKSMKYNPFAYLRSEKDILKLVNTLIANTKGDGEKAGEDFWVKSERLFYCALIGYIWYEAPEEEKNFTTLLEMINASEAREDDPEFQSPVDLMFERLEEKDPEHFAVRQYKKFLLSAGKTRSSILISCGARLAPFDIKELRDLMETDEMELDTIGDRKTALFVIISDTDDTFNFVVSILYTQLFNLLCDKADDEYGGRLPVHVRCLLDEFANIGQIPKFEKLIATIRSREISASIILQSQSQLKAIYKDNADTIVGNCDTTLFLGGKEKTTLKEMSEILGKETIDSFNTSENRGREVSHGLNYQKLGKQLMTEDEIAVMDGGKCILQLRGVRPFFSDKYDITKHPNYKYLSDYDKKNTFDMEKHLRRRPALVKPDEVFDYYEISESDLQEDTDHE